jgi:hypothetical protein
MTHPPMIYSLTYSPKILIHMYGSALPRTPSAGIISSKANYPKTGLLSNTDTPSRIGSSRNLVTGSHGWINYLAHRSFHIWDTRNKSRHGHDHATTRQAEKLQVHRDVSVLYQLRDSVLPSDQDLFCTSLDAHLARPLSTLKGWLANN